MTEGSESSPLPAARWLVAIYVSTMLVSASLLFLVQPMFARMSLPLLGGTPAVWAIAMCFFQAMLLGGYAYAHLLKSYLGARAAVLVHLVLMAGGWHFLPVHVNATLLPQDGAAAGLSLIWLMAQSIGYPFFFLSATAPLLQSWFARTLHPSADNPYFLYSASNIGSLGALILYPFVIEPRLGLAMQTRAWSVGYGVLMAGTAVSGLAMLICFRPPGTGQDAATQVAVPLRQKLMWVVMAFVPSALLVAWTNHIATDIASAPFLWLPPLMLYLLSFVVVFRDRPWVTVRLARILQLVSLPICWIGQSGLSLNLALPAIFFGAVFLFATAIICHRQLYEARPQAGQLTEFYMLMSVGGVLGGLFVSLLAPVIFTSVVEYPLLLIAALLSWAGLMSRKPLLAMARGAAVPLLAFLVVQVGIDAWGRPSDLSSLMSSKLVWQAALLGLIGGFFAVRHFAEVAVCAVLVAYASVVPAPDIRLQLRNYFGELKIVDRSAEAGFRILQHGTTIHGAELLDDVAATQSKPHALTYYTSAGGIGKALNATQQRLAAAGRTGIYRIVGLGAGSLACYFRPGEDWAYYEIDPNVTRVARDPAQFTFLSRCKPDMRVIGGDARITLQAEPGGMFDYLLIDAFSSDSVPIHLITVEALKLYLSKLNDDGILVLHVTNRYMDLMPIVAANLAAIDAKLQGRVLEFVPQKADVGAIHSIAVAISRNAATLAELDKLGGTAPLPAGVIIDPWTDDYSNLPAAIWRKLSATASWLRA